MTSFSLGLSIVSAIHRGPRPVWDWTPESLAPIFWAGGMQPATPARLFQEAAGTTPAAAAGQPVGKIARLKGSVDLTQATALSRPTLARWPKGGRRNLLTQTEFPNGTANWDVGSPQITATTLEGFEGALNFPNSPTGSIQAYKNYPSYVDGQPYTFSAYVKMLDGAAPSFNPATAASGDQQDFCLFMRGQAYIPAIIETLQDGVYRVAATVASSAGAQLWAGVGKYSGNRPRGFVVSGYQLVSGPVPLPYQRVRTINDIAQTGTLDLWHVYDDGGDSLPVVLPAGEYGLAWVDQLGAVSSATVTSDGVAAIDLLRAERQADVLIRAGAITAPELTALTGYWEGIYK